MELTTILTALGGVGAAVGSYFIARFKSRTDSFKSIIDANESFRAEIREDLLRAKNELAASTTQMDGLQKEIVTLRNTLTDSNSQIDQLKAALEKARIEREELIKRLVNYEIEVTRLRTVSTQYETELVAMRKSNQELVVKIHDLQSELQRYQATNGHSGIS